MNEGTASIIDRKLVGLRVSLNFLRTREGVALADYLADQTLQLAVERSFQEAIEACLDIARRVLTDAGIPLPDRNRDLFAATVPFGLIPADARTRYAEMASFRNLLVHEYDRIDPVRVHAALQHRLDDLQAFAAAVVAHLEGQGPD